LRFFLSPEWLSAQFELTLGPRCAYRSHINTPCKPALSSAPANPAFPTPFPFLSKKMFEFYLSGELASPYTMPLELDLAEYNMFTDILPDSPIESACTTPLASGRSSPSSDLLDFPLPADLSEIFANPQALEQSFAAFSEDRSFSVVDESSSGLSDDDSKMELKMKPAQKKRGRRPNSMLARPVHARSAADELCFKRSSHNVSERQRRKDLKSSFQALRACIPSIADDSRVHTGHILKQAIELIQQLKAEEARLLTAKARLLP
jgi:hypothetical protein